MSMKPQERVVVERWGRRGLVMVHVDVCTAYRKTKGVAESRCRRQGVA